MGPNAALWPYTYEPVWDGLALVPALVGGIATAFVVAAVTRLGTEGHFFGTAHA